MKGSCSCCFLHVGAKTGGCGPFSFFPKKSHNDLIQITLELTLNNNTMQPHCFNGKTRTTRSTSLILPADQRAYHPMLCGKKQLLFVVQCEKSKPAWEVREQLLAMKGGFVPQVPLIPSPVQVISWKCGFGRMRTLVLVTLIRKHGFKLFLGSFSLWTGSSTLRAFLAGVPLHVHVAMLIPDFDSKGCSPLEWNQLFHFGVLASMESSGREYVVFLTNPTDLFA